MQVGRLLAPDSGKPIFIVDRDADSPKFVQMPYSTVITYAKVNPGGIDQIAEEFDHIQSGLLAGEKAFLGAELCADRVKSTIILITRWKSDAAWERFRGSKAVDAFHRRLEAYFAEEPRSWVCDQLTFVERGEGEVTRVALGGGD